MKDSIILGKITVLTDIDSYGLFDIPEAKLLTVEKVEEQYILSLVGPLQYNDIVFLKLPENQLHPINIYPLLIELFRLQKVHDLSVIIETYNDCILKLIETMVIKRNMLKYYKVYVRNGDNSVEDVTFKQDKMNKIYQGLGSILKAIESEMKGE